MLILEVRLLSGPKVLVNWDNVNYFVPRSEKAVNLHCRGGEVVSLHESEPKMRSMLTRGGARIIRREQPKLPKQCPQCECEYGKCPNCGETAACGAECLECASCSYVFSGFDEFDRAQVT